MNRSEENVHWKELKEQYRGQDVIVDTDEWGYINFSPKSMEEVAGHEKFSYEEYLDIQKSKGLNIRGSFFLCHHEVALGFARQIEKINKKYVYFKRIYVSGMYMDGQCFDGKEDHVWMSIKGFEKYQVGDCLEFHAETYRYLKIGNGKQIDYGLRYPCQIKKVESYELPSDDDLLLQSIDQILCETCLYHDHCYSMCIADKEWLKNMRESMLKTVKCK